MYEEEVMEFLVQLGKTLEQIVRKTGEVIGYLSRAKESTTGSPGEEPMKFKQFTISKRKGGTANNKWSARIPLGKVRGEYKYKTFYAATQASAVEKAKAYLKSKDYMADKANLTKQDKKKLEHTDTINSFYPTYLKVYRQPYYKKGTVKNTESIFKNWVSTSPLAQMDIKKIEKRHILDFLASVPYEQQRHRIRLWLSNMFTAAVEHGLLDSSPMQNLRLPKAKSTPRSNFTRDEEERFVAQAKQSQYWMIYALMLYEGLRPGEAKALRPCDIKEKYIEVGQALNDWGEVDTTKTCNVRLVPIFDQFAELADRYRGSSTSLIFPKADKHTANDDYREICKGLGIDKVMYSLRHTFATRCAEVGISAKQVQLWMGHSEVETTLNYYTHISKELELANIESKSKL